jgi:predicted nucleotidyltransferase
MRDGTPNAFVERLKPVPGIVAILVGGSTARGTADKSSDTDLGLYYHRESPLNIAVLDAVAAECDDRKNVGLVTAIGEWGPWINGGDWNRP